MKKTIILMAISLFMLFGINAQTKQLTIKKGTNLSTIDGKGDDEQWQDVDPVAIDTPFGNENASVKAWFKMYYTDDYLYVYVDVTDDVHVPVWVGKADNEKVKDVHQFYDKVEIYFDVNDNLKDGNGPAYIGTEGGGGTIAPGHYQFAPWFEEDGYDSPFLMSGLLFGSMSDQAMVCYSLREDYSGYGVEFELPLKKFLNDKGEYLSKEAFENLPQGLGFDVTVVDNDADDLGRKRVVWCSSEQEAYYNMDGCGIVRFGQSSGIENLKTDTGHAKTGICYNLLGMRVDRNRKGIIICDGKKIIK